MSHAPRTAIIVSNFIVPGETFVNYHVAHLFGGNTVVVTHKSRKAWEGPRPVLAMDQIRPTALDRLCAPIAFVANHLRYGLGKIYAGAQRRALIAFLKQEKVEVVLCEFGHRLPLVLPAAESLGLPVFTYFRGVDASKILRERGMPEAYRRAARRTTGAFAVAQFLFDNLAREGIRFDRSEVIPSGADTAVFAPGDKSRRRVVAIGRMVDKKRPDITARAFIAAAQAHPDVEFCLVGGGPMQAECQRMIDEAGLRDRIQLPGGMSHEEIAQTLSGAEIFVQHSVVDGEGNTEGLPSVIQEAMASGCAVVSTRHAGIPEAVIEGETGLLVEEGDEAAYTQALLALLADPARAQSMGQAGREFACANLDKATLTRRIEAAILAGMAQAD